MKIKISEEFYMKRQQALLDWKPGAPRIKADSIILGLYKAQKECGKKGLKNLHGKVVVSVSDRMIQAWYPDPTSQKKFRNWVVKWGLVEKDRSWLNASLAKEDGKQPYCDSWHVTAGDCKGKMIEVEFDDNFGLFGIYKKAIIKAEGKQVDEAHSFHGMWAIDAYAEGKLTFCDFIEVGKAAHNCLKGKVKKGVSCRVFDAVALCKKELRSKCFSGMVEVFDIPGAVTFTAPLAMAAFGMTSFSDKDAINWATDLAFGASSDPYKRIWKAIYDIDPNTNAYGVDHKWTKAIRKTVKMDLQCVANCNLEYISECKEAYEGFFNNHCVQQNKRRQWLLLNAIFKANKPLLDAIAATKKSGIKDAFYRLHTFGEKMVMNVIIKELKKMGIVVHRVHDALWTSDKRVTQELIGKVLLRFFSKCKDGYGRKFILKMVTEAGMTKEEAEWVWEVIKPLKEKAIAA